MMSFRFLRGLISEADVPRVSPSVSHVFPKRRQTQTRNQISVEILSLH